MTNLVFKSTLVITLTVITAGFSEYKDSEVLYSSPAIAQYSAAKKDNDNSISSMCRLRKPAEIFFYMTVMVLFRN